MMSYDLKSYELAIRIRSKKTLLVEGVTDKKVLGRMLMEQGLVSGASCQCVIDDASILNREKSFTSLGNKEKVEQTAVQLSALSSKINWLVDREWEGVDLSSLPDPVPSMTPLAWGYRTKGHSIENYWLCADALNAYLKMFYGSELPAEFFVAISFRFAAMLRIATGFSLAARRLHIIKSCMGLARADHVQWTGTEYLPLIGFTQALTQRNVAIDMMNETLTELRRSDVQTLSGEALRWICHGHLGEEVIRACTANLAMEYGLGSTMKDQIERGFYAVKLAHDADWLARTDGSQCKPLGELIQWAV